MKGLAWKAENDEIDLRSAVAHTLDLGNSLLEKNVFSRFEVMDPRMKAVLRRLENETREHAAKARSLMKKNLTDGRFQKAPNPLPPDGSIRLTGILSEFWKRSEISRARSR